MGSNDLEPKPAISRRHVLATAAGVGFASCAPGVVRVAEAATWPTDRAWANAQPASVGVDSGLLMQAINYAQSKGSGPGSGIVIVQGKRIAFWGDQNVKYKQFSATKSFGSAMLGLAVADGVVALDTNCRSKWSGFGVPPNTNNNNGWAAEVTVGQLATHSAGFEKTGGFIPIFFQPGTRWSYSDGGANWLADLLTVLYSADLAGLMRSRIFSRIGISTTDLTWRQNAYRPSPLLGDPRREFGSGIDTNVDSLARFGLLMARGGAWNGQQLIPQGYARDAGRTSPLLSGLQPTEPGTYPNAPRHYGLLWWNNADGVIADLPRDAFWAWGKGEQLILCVPSRDLVAARCGPAWSGTFGKISVLAPFFGPLGQALSA